MQTNKTQKLPNGWQIKTIGEVCEKISAGGDRPDDCTPEKTEKIKYLYLQMELKITGFMDIPKLQLLRSQL